MITVLLVDDRNVILKGVRYLIETTPEIEVVATTRNETETIARARSYQPHIAITDVFMQNMDGMKVTRKIRESCPGTQVLAVTQFDSAEYVKSALLAGVDGYVLKGHIRDDLLEGIRALYCGSQYFSQKVEHIAKQFITEN